MNAIEQNKTNEVTETEMNKRDLIKKAVVTFREGYQENKHNCSLEIFMLYAIIKGKHVDVTIIDNRYKDGVSNCSLLSCSNLIILLFLYSFLL